MATASTPVPLHDHINTQLVYNSAGQLVTGTKSVTSADGSVVLSGATNGAIDLSAALAIKTADDKLQTDLKALIAANSTWGAFQTAAASWAAE